MAVIVSIGGMGIALADLNPEDIPDDIAPWIVESGETTAICRTFNRPVPVPEEAPLFDAGLLWKVYDNDGDGIRLVLFHGSGRNRPYQMLSLDGGLTQGTAILDEDAVTDEPRHFALRAPLHELWTAFLLMRRRGLLVHGLGVLIDGRVHLFAGRSGAGKSTLARIFEQAGVGEILSDDRLIIRPEGNAFSVYGTPWHGEARFESPGSGTLASIHFLNQSTSCRSVALDGADATARMAAACFVAGWPRESGLQSVLDLSAGVVSMIPTRRLDFTPDTSALTPLMEWIR